jgi:hypothetical protein
MLNAYLLETQRLLQNPPAPSTLYNTNDLTAYINTARGQLAGESQSVRVLGTLAIINGTPSYNFSGINVSGTAGVQNVFNVRMATLQVSGGAQFLNAWSWEWFNRYFISQTGIANAQPTEWAQYGQGVNGTLVFYPTPNANFTATLDTICNPAALAADGDPEAIPYPWTDCVPYFAAYLALLSAQSQARQADANRMFERYEEFVARARRMSTASVLPSNYMQAPDMVPPASAQKSQGKGG